MPDITSRQHPIVRAFKAALDDPSVALLDGWHLLHEADRAGLIFTTVAVTTAPAAAADADLLDRLSHVSNVVTVSAPVMDAVSPVRTPTGVVALALRRSHALPDLLTPPPALVLVADAVQDPGNVGALIRSAEAGGATGTLLTGASADPWGWKALRAGMGSTFRLPNLRSPDAEGALDRLRAAGISMVAAVPHGGTPLPDIDLRGPVALLVGAEGPGLDPSLVRLCDRSLSIPMAAPVDSLNVAVAAAVMIYEARRQRS